MRHQNENFESTDVLIIGAGAAGMMCGIAALARGRRVILLDHARKIGEKIRISGGGRCNFTNLETGAQHFICANPHFVKSALGRYSPHDFLAMVERHNIRWHEKAKGQLFCDGSARQIVEMLLSELRGADIRAGVSLQDITRTNDGFEVQTSHGLVLAQSLVVATGGKSIPKIGASGLGYQIASQFGLPLRPTRAGLVPLTFGAQDLQRFKALAGLAIPVEISGGKGVFRDDMLFTHRGLSGPAILQISSFWQEGMPIRINLLPDGGLREALKDARAQNGRQALQTLLARLFPKNLARDLAQDFGFSGTISDLSKPDINALERHLCQWQVWPTGTEGYRTAEVTLGGVDTDALDARTLQSRAVPGLFFIGEVLDVTGWLGGYNFQWAWASGQAAGQIA